MSDLGLLVSPPARFGKDTTVRTLIQRELVTTVVAVRPAQPSHRDSIQNFAPSAAQPCAYTSTISPASAAVRPRQVPLGPEAPPPVCYYSNIRGLISRYSRTRQRKQRLYDQRVRCSSPPLKRERYYSCPPRASYQKSGYDRFHSPPNGESDNISRRSRRRSPFPYPGRSPFRRSPTRFRSPGRVENPSARFLEIELQVWYQ